MGYFLECHVCEAKIAAEIAGEIAVDPGDEPPYRVTLAECPHCHSALVGFQYLFHQWNENDEWVDEYEEPDRIWPSPPLSLSWAIPVDIRNSLIEARLCLKAKAYTASVVMSGRSLEGIGRHFWPRQDGKSNLMLSAGLKKLRDEGRIDERLFEWGQELADERNWAAHPSKAQFDRQDAEDVFRFTYNICEYIFVLTSDFERFQKRKEERGRISKRRGPHRNSIAPD